MRSSVLPIAFVLIASAPVCAASPLPPPVEAHLAADVQDCETHDAKFEKGFMTQRDVNGDGKEDYVLDYGKFTCGGAVLNCGSAGCLTTVFASSDRGYVKVLNENVRGLEFKIIGGRPAMILGLHGSACGKMGAAACGATLYWNGEKFSPAH